MPETQSPAPIRTEMYPNAGTMDPNWQRWLLKVGSDLKTLQTLGVGDASVSINGTPVTY